MSANEKTQNTSDLTYNFHIMNSGPGLMPMTRFELTFFNADLPIEPPSDGFSSVSELLRHLADIVEIYDGKGE